MRRELRTEVGFGCPVEGCGSPYLTWHHFDPPWRDGHQHNPNGMVALCLQHHKEADSGAFSPDQLRVLKSDPYLRRVGGQPAGHFNWKREQLILEAGGGLAIRCPVLLEMAGRPVIWLSSDPDGNQLLNLEILGADGAPAFVMRDNDWLAIADVQDLEAPPSVRSLIVRAPRTNVRVAIEFKPMTMDDVRVRLEKWEADGTRASAKLLQEHISKLRQQGAPEHFIESIGRSAAPASRVDHIMEQIQEGWPHDDLVTCTLEAQIPYPYPVVITASKIVLPGENVISGAIMLGGGTAISLQ